MSHISVMQAIRERQKGGPTRKPSKRKTPEPILEADGPIVEGYDWDWSGFGLTVYNDRGESMFLQGEDGSDLYDELEAAATDREVEMILEPYESAGIFEEKEEEEDGEEGASKPKKKMKAKKDDEDDDEDEEDDDEKSESAIAERLKKRKKKTGPVDPKRSRAAKKAFKKNKNKIVKARKKFAKSPQGKRLNKQLAKFNSKNESEQLIEVSPLDAESIIDSYVTLQNILWEEVRDPMITCLFATDLVTLSGQVAIAESEGENVPLGLFVEYENRLNENLTDATATTGYDHDDGEDPDDDESTPPNEDPKVKSKQHAYKTGEKPKSRTKIHHSQPEGPMEVKTSAPALYDLPEVEVLETSEDNGKKVRTLRIPEDIYIKQVSRYEAASYDYEVLT